MPDSPIETSLADAVENASHDDANSAAGVIEFTDRTPAAGLDLGQSKE